MKVTMNNPAVPMPGSDPLRAAAKDLHRQFVAEMLKQAKLTEALGAKGNDGLAPALAHEALDAIAEDVVEAQPRFTQQLYGALEKSGKGNLSEQAFTQM